MMAVSRRVKILGIVLIIFVGLLNFHIPHFLFESTTEFSSATYLLELVFLANLLGAVVAAVGILRDQRWGWRLSIFIAVVSCGLYLAQKMVGLPGLPKSWLEPSRIVALVVESLFVGLAIFTRSAMLESNPARLPSPSDKM